MTIEDQLAKHEEACQKRLAGKFVDYKWMIGTGITIIALLAGSFITSATTSGSQGEKISTVEKQQVKCETEQSKMSDKLDKVLELLSDMKAEIATQRVMLNSPRYTTIGGRNGGR